MSVKIMGVINLNDNSFVATSRKQTKEAVLETVQKMAQEGADIIDLGVEATHPQVKLTVVDAKAERALLIPIIEWIRQQVSIPLSIDTSRPEVMQAGIAAGANMINDQRALTSPGALETAATLQVPVVLMHMGKAAAVASYLQARITAAMTAGIKKENIIIDPGFGGGHFGKTTEENLFLLKHLDDLVSLGYPILAGLSRKTFIGDILHKPTEDRLAGSLGLAVLAMLKGASIIRTHDVAETYDALKMVAVTLA